MKPKENTNNDTLISIIEKLRLQLEAQILQSRKEQSIELLDFREEQRFKVKSLMECINTIGEKTVVMKHELTEKENTVDELRKEKQDMFVSFKN